ncbi:MAG: glycosyltransferase [Acidobacteriota bacterium]
MDHVKRIAVLNPYLPLLGGGEKYMGHMCQFLEGHYPDARIDILIDDHDHTRVGDDGIDDLNKRFGLDLKRTTTRRIKLEEELSEREWLKNQCVVARVTGEYDIFINNMFLSRHAGKAKKNVYICMFPPKPLAREIHDETAIAKTTSHIIDRIFVRCYDKVVTISNFADRWTKEYLKGIRDSVVVYPPGLSERGMQDNYEENRKENRILGVGRFFVGAHNKKQLEMVRLYLSSRGKLKEYELHLVGALAGNKRDIAYVDKIKAMVKDEKVFLHVNAPFGLLTDMYRKAKILWHATGFNEDANRTPEKMEHFGIATVEAMGYGAVPVVIDGGAQPEIVQDGESGFLWGSESDWIGQTKRLIQDQALRVRLAKAASSRSRAFSVERFYESLRGVFDTM